MFEIKIKEIQLKQTSMRYQMNAFYVVFVYFTQLT